MFGKRSLLLAALLATMAMILVACGGEPETIVVTQVVTETVVETRVVVEEGEEVVVEVTREVETIVEVEVPAEDEGDGAAAGGAQSDVYTIGIFEDPISLNYWAYLDPNSSVWTAYVLTGYAGSLYTLSYQRYDFVPSLAADLPAEFVDEGDGTFSITVPMIEDATWSDGEAITAEDVAFTWNTALMLDLGGNWRPGLGAGTLVGAEVVDEYTVKIIFNQLPGLAQWQFGVAQAPILPEHYWAPKIADAMAFIEGMELPEDCSEEASEEDLATCEAFVNARQTLYSLDAEGSPVAGAFATDQLEAGAFVSRSANPNYYSAGEVYTHFTDGTYQVTRPDGEVTQYYGEGGGDVELEVTEGPFVENVVMTIYGSQDAAFLAMIDGEVDYVLNPLSIARGLRQQAEASGEITTLTNPDNGLFYLAFNMRKAPFNDLAFRTAVDIVLDKEFVSNNILQGTVIPAYSVVPPGNAFWSYNEQIEKPYIGLDRETRIALAIEVLTDAGYTWEVLPAWNADTVDVDPGEGLRGPDGNLIEEVTILGPGPSYDPQRASFNQWITEYMNELGIPTRAELTGFNTILGPVFIEATFDMYILGWSLTIYPDYVCDFFKTENDVLNGGNNSPGFNNEEFDALCDVFLAETDITAAQTQNQELQAILAAEKPYIPLFYRQSIDLIRRNVELPYTDQLSGISDVGAGMQNLVKVFDVAQ